MDSLQEDCAAIGTFLKEKKTMGNEAPIVSSAFLMI
jgi:hypothetical protein